MKKEAFKNKQITKKKAGNPVIVIITWETELYVLNSTPSSHMMKDKSKTWPWAIKPSKTLPMQIMFFQ